MSRHSPRRAQRLGGCSSGDDRGETLLEILLTIVITGLTVTALISSLATAGNGAAAGRDSVRADVVMRNYAEATKFGVDKCVAGGSYTVVYTPPAGFSVAALPTGSSCPAVSSTRLLQLSVTAPSGAPRTMQIKVRTP